MQHCLDTTPVRHKAYSGYRKRWNDNLIDFVFFSFRIVSYCLGVLLGAGGASEVFRFGRFLLLDIGPKSGVAKAARQLDGCFKIAIQQPVALR
eukprot:4371212-Amphidinium_carterae.1